MEPYSPPGWHLIGQYPDHEPSDVGSWLLHHNGEAMLLEVPPGLTVAAVWDALARTNCYLKYIAASHTHFDHLDREAWGIVTAFWSGAAVIRPSPHRRFTDTRLEIGGEAVWLACAPKHSVSDRVTIFRGVAMTGDIELGTLNSCNSEVPLATKRSSMWFLRGFEDRNDYRVHTVMSAHCNDLRTNVYWPSLFSYHE